MRHPRRPGCGSPARGRAAKLALVIAVAAAACIVARARPDTEQGTERWFDAQRLDHYDGTNSATFTQRFFVNASLYRGAGAPIFLCVGGEGPPLEPTVVVTGDKHCADMVLAAQEHGALMLALEHRYYGPSVPTADLSTPSLRWLSSRQALGDLAAFHAFAQRHFGLPPGARWVAWGGSYPGMLAAWARLKLPHLFHAAVASSAPLRAELDMRGYNDVVALALGDVGVGGGPDCLAAVRDAFAQLGQLLRDAAGRRRAEALFDVCDAGNGGGGGALDDVDAARNLVEALAELFPVQGNEPACGSPRCNLRYACAAMLDEGAGGSELERLGALARSGGAATLRGGAAAAAAWAAAGGSGIGRVRRVRPRGECVDVSQAALLRDLTDTSLAGGVGRLWFFQTCTEVGFYQTCEADSACPFFTGEPLLTLDASLALCAAAFNATPAEVAGAVRDTLQWYGGDRPASSRVLYVNGGIDPWSANSVRISPSRAQPVLWVKDASHHYWTHPPLPTDAPAVVRARAIILAQVARWLSQP